ncbi:hypothetical protein Pfo_025582 [Paulownia fortunei]|nr:hypothetical protein Pfo_025582 [Paulownia fortunei]
MANSNRSSTIVLFLCLNLLFFTLVSCHNSPVTTNTCPKDTLKLGVCANLLNWLIGIHIGNPPKEQCCGLIKGLVDLDVAACLCAALKANILGIITIDFNEAINLLLNSCGKNVPSAFKCV